MTVKAAIFDLDGTLVDLPIDYRALYAEFRKIMGTTNIQPITKTVAALNTALRGRVFEAWTAAENAILPKMTIVKEGMALYEQHGNVPKALVTMQAAKTVERVLAVTHLFFQVVVTREDSLDRATQIRVAVKRLGMRPEDVIVIADRESDRIAAKKVGCAFKSVKE